MSISHKQPNYISVIILLTEKRQLRRLFKDIDENYEKTVGLLKKLIKYQKHLSL